ncbi:MAG: hypothetical protein HRT45_03075 [Bdellovibrionales bacterium]|nr:hypothetical protein [Bdellovibrionales bacterium]
MRTGPVISQNEQIYRDLIDEFKKSEPNSDHIEKCMTELKLDYQSDQFANMERVLTALNFHFKAGDIPESQDN